MISFGYTLNFASGQHLPVLLRNFYEPEDGYVWSHAKWCEIVFPFNAGLGSRITKCDLMLDLDVFKAPPAMEGQSIMVYLNGTRIAQYTVTGQNTFVISIPTSLLKEQENSLVIDTPESTKPEKYGIADDRVLGVQLFSAQIQAS